MAGRTPWWPTARIRGTPTGSASSSRDTICPTPGPQGARSPPRPGTAVERPGSSGWARSKSRPALRPHVGDKGRISSPDHRRLEIGECSLERIVAERGTCLCLRSGDEICGESGPRGADVVELAACPSEQPCCFLEVRVGRLEGSEPSSSEGGGAETPGAGRHRRSARISAAARSPDSTAPLRYPWKSIDVCSPAKWQFPCRLRSIPENFVYWPTFQYEYDPFVHS